MSQLFGGTIDDDTSSQEINPALMSEIELDNFFDAFQKNINKMSKKLIYIGIGMFFANFCWAHTSLSMVFHLKEISF